jgi:hypothetical protein
MHAQHASAFSPEFKKAVMFSNFDIFCFGIGPFTSHTIGPVRGPFSCR